MTAPKAPGRCSIRPGSDRRAALKGHGAARGQASRQLHEAAAAAGAAARRLTAAGGHADLKDVPGQIDVGRRRRVGGLRQGSGIGMRVQSCVRE